MKIFNPEIINGRISGSMSGTVESSSYSQNGGGTAGNIQTIGIRIVTQDSFIVAGSKGYRHIPNNSNITKIRGIANTTGSINLNIKRNNTLLGNYQLSNQVSSIDTILTNWTTSLSANDLIEFSISQSSTYITDLTFFMDLENV